MTPPSTPPGLGLVVCVDPESYDSPLEKLDEFLRSQDVDRKLSLLHSAGFHDPKLHCGPLSTAPSADCYLWLAETERYALLMEDPACAPLAQRALVTTHPLALTRVAARCGALGGIESSVFWGFDDDPAEGGNTFFAGRRPLAERTGATFTTVNACGDYVPLYIYAPSMAHALFSFVCAALNAP